MPDGNRPKVFIQEATRVQIASYLPIEILVPLEFQLDLRVKAASPN